MKRQSKQKKTKWSRLSDADLDAMAEITTADLQRADSDWNEGAKQLDELLESQSEIVDDGENS